MSGNRDNEKLEKGLQTLVGMAGVRSAFIADRSGVVKAAQGAQDAATIQAIAKYFQPLLGTIEAAGELKQLNLRYAQGTLFFKGMATGDHLAMILESSCQIATLLPSMNLTIVGLERALQNAEPDQTMPKDAGLAHLLSSAEEAIGSQSFSDSNFFGSLRSIAFFYFGPVGRELLDNGLDELWLTLPVKQPQEMRSLVDYFLERIPTPIKRELFSLEADRLLQKYTPQ